MLAVICQLADNVVWHALHEGMQGSHQRLPSWHQLGICPNLHTRQTVLDQCLTSST